MKLLTTTAALVTLIASPAFAQYQDPYQYGQYSGYGPSAYQAYGYVAPGEAYAQGPYAGAYYGRSANPAFDVYNTRGRYIGSDPDPRVRSELARDPAYGD
jgi:hypothetical protein